MLQKIVNKVGLEVGELEQYTDRQQSTVDELVDWVNDITNVRSWSDQSIPRIIYTSDSGPSTDSSKLSTAQALIASLQTGLSDAKKNYYQS